MRIKVTQGDITKMSSPALIINLFEGIRKPGGVTGVIDHALDGAITQLIIDGEIKGQKGELTLIHTLGKLPVSRILVAGLGTEKEFNQDTVRQITANSCRLLRNRGVKQAATIAHGAGIGGIDTFLSGRSIAEGAILGLYSFDRYTNKEKGSNNLESLEIVELDLNKTSDLERGVNTGKILGEATCIARDMVNEPANVLTPTLMAELAHQMAEEQHLYIEVLEQETMEELGMGALLGVARGSTEPPKLITLRYDGDPNNPSNNLGIVGKGITFDSGGISIKPATGMEEMKGDMAGGASAIGAIKAISELRVKLNVTAVVPATENMPGGSAQRPGDIVRTMSGKTIEVVNTDAEGRLVLADAVTYARKMGLNRIVDVATLTGAVVIALGKVCTGIMGNNEELIDQIIQAGKDSGEKIWQLPLYLEYGEQIKSNIADMKNVGGREAGSITGAYLIKEFAGDAAWAHLDIAGTSTSNKEAGVLVKGATGTPVRTLVSLAQSLALD